MPMAPSVPMMVDAMVASAATSSVTFSAAMMSSRWSSFLYQFSVKPVHSARDTDALKDNAIITTMGTYRNASTSAR